MIATLVRILLLTLIWAALQGTFDVGNLVLGGLFAWGVLWISHPMFNPSERRLREGVRPLPRLWRTFVLILVFIREVVLSAVEVAWLVIQPTLRIRPAIVAVPLDVRTDREITVLANLISLTPGTLSLDVSPDRSQLFVHTISVETDDGREVITDIKETLEKHVNRTFGPRPRPRS